MIEKKYSGTDGWAKLPAADPLSEPIELQKTFFPIFDRSLPSAAPGFEPPVLIEQRKPSARRGRKEGKGQGHFDFDAGEKPLVVYPEEQGFTALKVPQAGIRAGETVLCDGREIAVPKDIASLKQTFGLGVLKEDALLGLAGQLRAVTIALSSENNLELHGETGCGKTFVELMIASRYISEKKPVLLLAPTEILVSQHAAKAGAIFNLPPEAICELGGRIDWRDRPAHYSSGNCLLYISTPESLLNDINRGTADANKFALIIYDEGHRAVGKYAYAVMDGLFPEHARRLLFSATPAKNLPLHVELVERLNIRECHEISAPQNLKFEAPFFIKIDRHKDPLMYGATKRLYNAVILCALKLNKTLQASSEFRHGLKHNELLKRYQNLTNILKCEQEMKKASGGEEKEEKKASFKFPTYREFEEIGEKLKSLAQSSPRRFGRACSEFCELQHLIYLYVTLTCEGKYCFLRTVGRMLWKLRFDGSYKKFSDFTDSKAPRNFHRRIYNSKGVVKTYAELAKGTLFNELQMRTSNQYGLLLKKAFPEGPPPDAVVKRRFFEKAREEFVGKDYIDHPEEFRMRNIVLRHTTFGCNERILVYNASAHRTRFYMDRLNHALGETSVRAGYVIGKKHAPRRVRNLNLEEFRSGSSRILGINSAANEGLDIPGVNILIRQSYSSQPIERVQTGGRAGRGGGSGSPDGLSAALGLERAYIYNLVTLGTHDEYRYYAGLRNTGRMYRDLQKIRDLVFEVGQPGPRIAMRSGEAG